MFHLKHNAIKHVRQLKLIEMYKNYQLSFHLELNVLINVVWLPDAEKDDFYEKQSKIVMDSIPQNEKKLLAGKQFIRYFRKTWLRTYRKETNYFIRTVDYTNNLLEIFNGLWVSMYSKKLDLFSFLTALQEQLAMAALDFKKMKYYKRSDNEFDYESIFNKCPKNRVLQKELLLKCKSEYAALSNSEKTFDVQRLYAKNIFFIFKQWNDELLSLSESIQSANVDPIEEPSDEKVAEVDLAAQYLLLRYAESDVCKKLAGDINSDSLSEKLHSELLKSVYLEQMLKKHGLFREDGNHLCFIQGNRLKKLTLIKEPLNCSVDLCMVAVQNKDRQRAYPSLIFSVQPPLVFYFQPLNIKNKDKHWDVFETVNQSFFNFYAM